MLYCQNTCVILLIVMSITSKTECMDDPTLPNSNKGVIKWNLMENPVIFGTNIHLVCHLPNDTTCCNDYRKWNVGYQYNLIITNGTSYNRSKYKEDLIVNDRKSVLTIFSFSETDVNIPYYCTYGFNVYQSVLELNEHAFEFHPTEKLPIIPIVNGNNISFKFQFKKVFPIPVCKTKLGIQNYSSLLFVTVQQLDILYETTLALNYTFSSLECRESLSVVCAVGETLFPIVEHVACSSYEVSAKDINLKDRDVVLISVSLTVAITSVVIFIYCRMKAKDNRHECSNGHNEETVELKSLENR